MYRKIAYKITCNVNADAGILTRLFYLTPLPLLHPMPLSQPIPLLSVYHPIEVVKSLTVL